MKPSIRSCVVIVNPGSTNYRRALRLSKKLSQYLPDVTIKTFELPDIREARQVIHDMAGTLDERTLLCIAGGDGTISLVVNELLCGKGIPPKAQQAIILPLWGGNANDLAYMVNGTAYRASLAKLFDKGRVVAVAPLEISLKNQTKETKLAVNYASFGASAYAAKYLNRLNRQNSLLRLFTEAGSVMRAAIEAKPFPAMVNGKHASIYDLVLLNGSRIAKVYRAPNRLTDRVFFEFNVSHKHPLVLFYFAQLLQVLTVKRKRRTHYTLTIEQAAWAQVDGEVLQLAPHTEITVQPYTKTFNVLSTKLRS